MEETHKESKLYFILEILVTVGILFFILYNVEVREESQYKDDDYKRDLFLPLDSLKEGETWNI